MFLKNFFAHISQLFTTVASKIIALGTAVAATVAAVMHFSAATPTIALDEQDSVSAVTEKKQNHAEKLTVTKPKFTHSSRSSRSRDGSTTQTHSSINTTDEATEGSYDGFSLGNRGVDARGLSPKDAKAKNGPQSVAGGIAGQQPETSALGSSSTTETSDTHVDDILTHREIQAGSSGSVRTTKGSGGVPGDEHDEKTYEEDRKKAEDSEVENFMKNFSGGDSSAGFDTRSQPQAHDPLESEKLSDQQQLADVLQEPGVGEAGAKELPAVDGDVLPGQETPMSPEAATTPDASTCDLQPDDGCGHGSGDGCEKDRCGGQDDDDDEDDCCGATLGNPEEDFCCPNQPHAELPNLTHVINDAAHMASVAENGEEDDGFGGDVSTGLPGENPVDSELLVLPSPDGLVVNHRNLAATSIQRAWRRHSDDKKDDKKNDEIYLDWMISFGDPVAKQSQRRSKEERLAARKIQDWWERVKPKKAGDSVLPNGAINDTPVPNENKTAGLWKRIASAALTKAKGVVKTAGSFVGLGGTPAQAVEQQPVHYDEVLAQMYLQEFDDYCAPKHLVYAIGKLQRSMFVCKENVEKLLLRVGALQNKNKETQITTWSDPIKAHVQAGLKTVLDYLLTWDKCAGVTGLKTCGYAAWVNTIKTKDEVDALSKLLTACDEIVPAEQKNAINVGELRAAIEAKLAKF